MSLTEVDTVIKNGTVITGEGRQHADVLISEGQIAATPASAMACTSSNWEGTGLWFQSTRLLAS